MNMQQSSFGGDLRSPAAAIHLNVHFGEDFQSLIAQEMVNLPDDDENE